MSVEILTGDCRQVLKDLPEKSINCCVTSPPYWGLRDYGVDGQLGLEPTPEEYIEKMVEVFRGVHRVLRDDGTLWLNIGDSYVSNPNPDKNGDPLAKEARKRFDRPNACGDGKIPGLKLKDMVGIPWMLAFALRADGWYLRQDIIWNKPNPMPESVKDRCTKSHEYIFLLSKSNKYYFDQEAIKEPVTGTAHRRCKDTGIGFGHGTDKNKRNRDRVKKIPQNWETGKGSHNSFHKDGRRPPGVGPKSAPTGSGIKSNESFQAAIVDLVENKNKRSVWEVPTQGFSEAHFATFPEKLIEPCILAGCPKGGTVIDPFGGSGTTGRVAIKYNRKAILIELNPEYIELQNKRTSNVQRKIF